MPLCTSVRVIFVHCPKCYSLYFIKYYRLVLAKNNGKQLKYFFNGFISTLVPTINRYSDDHSKPSNDR
jgi:hypothetical protein